MTIRAKKACVNRPQAVKKGKDWVKPPPSSSQLIIFRPAAAYTSASGDSIAQGPGRACALLPHSSVGSVVSEG